MKKLMVVSVAVVCKEEDVERIEQAFINADVAQEGLYGLGTNVRDATEQEITETRFEVPYEFLDESFDLKKQA